MKYKVSVSLFQSVFNTTGEADKLAKDSFTLADVLIVVGKFRMLFNVQTLLYCVYRMGILMLDPMEYAKLNENMSI